MYGNGVSYVLKWSFLYNLCTKTEQIMYENGVSIDLMVR